MTAGAVSLIVTTYRNVRHRRPRPSSACRMFVSPNLWSILLLATCLGGTAFAVARADDPKTVGNPENRPDKSPRREMSLDQAVRIVQRRYRARVVRAETKHEGGRTVFHLRLLNDSGRVWTVKVEAANGPRLQP